MATKKGSKKGEIIDTGTDKRRVTRDSKGRIDEVTIISKKIANPKSTRNTGTDWTKEDEKALKQLAKENTPTRVMGLKLGRTESSIRSKAQELDISLKPTNQSPYTRKKGR
jgi:hypothetical protein